MVLDGWQDLLIQCSNRWIKQQIVRSIKPETRLFVSMIYHEPSILPHCLPDLIEKYVFLSLGG